jgi:hypothetical protein
MANESSIIAKSTILCGPLNKVIPYYKKTHPMPSFWKADLKAAYFAEIGRLPFSSAIEFLYPERLGGLLKPYRRAA